MFSNVITLGKVPEKTTLITFSLQYGKLSVHSMFHLLLHLSMNAILNMADEPPPDQIIACRLTPACDKETEYQWTNNLRPDKTTIVIDALVTTRHVLARTCALTPKVDLKPIPEAARGIS